VAGTSSEPEVAGVTVGGTVAGVAFPAPSVRFEPTVFARPGWAQAATAVNAAAAATEAATTVRVTTETRRRPASRAWRRPDREAPERGERGEEVGIEPRIGQPAKSQLRIDQESGKIR
jgi:hypothetical protein